MMIDKQLMRTRRAALEMPDSSAAFLLPWIANKSDAKIRNRVVGPVIIDTCPVILFRYGIKIANLT